MSTTGEVHISRRIVLAGTAAGLGVTIANGNSAIAQGANPQPTTLAPVMLPVTMEVNGQQRHLTLDTRTTLLDTLREHLQLTGSKKGCDHGQCGSCTVMVDGYRINACLTLAVMHQGSKVTTIEGMGTPGKLHPMQAAFVKHDGYQCGYCTPGQICSAIGVLAEIKAGTPSHVTADLMAPVAATNDEMRERMSGNICRCGAYSNILEAMTEVKGDFA